MPAKTPVSKAKAAKQSTAKATPKSPSLDLSDDAGNIASSKKQLQFKSTPAAKAAGASASAKKRPLAIKEEEEPVAKKGKTPSKVSAHANCKKILKQLASSPIHLPPALFPFLNTGQAVMEGTRSTSSSRTRICREELFDEACQSKSPLAQAAACGGSEKCAD